MGNFWESIYLYWRFTSSIHRVCVVFLWLRKGNLLWSFFIANCVHVSIHTEGITRILPFEIKQMRLNMRRHLYSLLVTSCSITPSSIVLKISISLQKFRDLSILEGENWSVQKLGLKTSFKRVIILILKRLFHFFPKIFHWFTLFDYAE